MKRIGLFILTNLAVIAVLSIVLQLLGIESVLDESGVDLDLQLVDFPVRGRDFFSELALALEQGLQRVLALPLDQAAHHQDPGAHRLQLLVELVGYMLIDVQVLLHGMTPLPAQPKRPVM